MKLPPRESGPTRCARRALGIRSVLAALAARSTGRLIKATGSGAASNLPGKLVNLVAPSFLSEQAARLTEGFALVTGTNGKTTTTAMAAAILRANGRQLIHNAEGANLLSGIAAAFAQQPLAPFALLEVDEAALPGAVARLGAPRAVVLTNLFRDQLDRYGEIDRLAEAWVASLRGIPGLTLIINADDPLVTHVALTSGLPLVTFGLQPAPEIALAGANEVSDAPVCPHCNAPLEYARRWMAHFGEYRCPQCGFARPRPDLLAHDIVLRDDGVQATVSAPEGELPLELHVQGLHTLYNALAALGLSGVLGIDASSGATALRSYRPVFGRSSTYQMRGARVHVNLVKNPAGLNQTLRTLRTVPGTKALIFVLNDRIADGRDISWIWDADLESLLPEANIYVASGTRPAGMALRLKYAGVPTARLSTAPDVRTALLSLLAAGEHAIYVLPTYTALREVRAALRTERAVLQAGGATGDAHGR